MLYIRAMIAAAAADGRIDEAEQAGIVEGLRQSGLDAKAEAFLEDELKNPASASDLAAAVGSRKQALQGLYGRTPRHRPRHRGRAHVPRRARARLAPRR